MKVKYLALPGALLFGAAIAVAVDLGGRWESTLATPDGEFKIVYEFAPAADQLTGVVRSEWGDWPMLELAAKDDGVSFHVDTDNGTYATSAVLKDGDLIATINGPQGEMHQVFKRPATDVAGRWHGTIEGPDGNMEVVFTLRPDGEKLNGTVSGPMGEAPFVNGTIHGDDLRFDVDFEGMLIVHTGKAHGDEIQLQVKTPEFDMTMKLRREKAEPGTSI